MIDRELPSSESPIVEAMDPSSQPMSASKKGLHAQTLNGVGAQSLIASIEAHSAVVGMIGLGYIDFLLAARSHSACFQTHKPGGD